MATYGAQPQSATGRTGFNNTASGNKKENSGLFADLFSSQPAPKNLTVPQKDLLIFSSTSRGFAERCSPSAGITAHC